jgi:hypothetical protein
MRPILQMAATCAVVVGCVSEHVDSGGAAPPVVTVVAREYAFDGPDTIDAGPVTLRLVSRAREHHDLIVARIDSGHTRDEYRRTLTATDPPPWVTFVGGVGTIEAGDSAAATLRLSPGLYAITCNVEDAKGNFHSMDGMLHYLVVRDHPNGAELPRADVSLAMTDYRFVVPDSLRAGRQIIEMRNTSPHVHMALLWRMTPGRSMADVVRWMHTFTANGAWPVTLAGGISDLHPGGVAQLVVTLEPGRYVIACLVDDVEGRTPHYDLGMLKELVVH